MDQQDKLNRTRRDNCRRIWRNNWLEVRSLFGVVERLFWETIKRLRSDSITLLIMHAWFFRADFSLMKFR